MAQELKPWVLRVDFDVVPMDPVKQIIGSWKHELLCVFENHIRPNKKRSDQDQELEHKKNPHMHCFFLDNRARQNIIKEFRKIDKFVGNKAYSLIEAKSNNEIRLFRYLCKGEGSEYEQKPVHVLFKQGIRFSNEFIQDRHREYWAEREVWKSLKPGEKSNMLLHQECEMQIRKQKIHYEERQKMCEEIIKIYNKRKRPFALSAVTNHCNDIQVTLSLEANDPSIIQAMAYKASIKD